MRRSVRQPTQSAKLQAPSPKRRVDQGRKRFAVTEAQTQADIETLARMAARLAGRDPDEHVRIKIACQVAFEGEIWRYPDFLGRAKEAYSLLLRPTGPAL